MKIMGEETIAANAAVKNVLAGSAFEFMKRNGRVRFYVVGPAGGGALATIQSGADVMMEESPVSRQARVPVIPDDLTAEDMAIAGDRLKLALRNSTGAPIVVFWAVEITEL